MIGPACRRFAPLWGAAANQRQIDRPATSTVQQAHVSASCLARFRHWAGCSRFPCHFKLRCGASNNVGLAKDGNGLEPEGGPVNSGRTFCNVNAHDLGGLDKVADCFLQCRNL